MKERGVTAALILGQNVNLAMELGVRMNAAGLAQHLAALDIGSLDAAQQSADVVAGLGIIQDLAEHLDTGHDGLLLLMAQTNQLNLVAVFSLPRSTLPVATVAAAGDG